MISMKALGLIEVPAYKRAMSEETESPLFEAGCGTGRLTHVFAGLAPVVVAADMSRDSIVRNRARHHGRTRNPVLYVHCDLTHLPLQDHVFGRCAKCGRLRTHSLARVAFAIYRTRAPHPETRRHADAFGLSLWRPHQAVRERGRTRRRHPVFPLHARRVERGSRHAIRNRKVHLESGHLHVHDRRSSQVNGARINFLQPFYPSAFILQPFPMRRIFAVALPVLLAFLLLTRGAEWWSEKWWFAALDQSATWWTYTKWRAGIFAVAGGLWLAIVGLNVRLAWHQSLALRQPLSLLGGGLQNIAVQLSPSLRMGRLLLVMTVWGTAWLGAVSAANRFDVWVLLVGALRDDSQLGFFSLSSARARMVFRLVGFGAGPDFHRLPDDLLLARSHRNRARRVASHGGGAAPSRVFGRPVHRVERRRLRAKRVAGAGCFRRFEQRHFGA